MMLSSIFGMFTLINIKLLAGMRLPMKASIYIASFIMHLQEWNVYINLNSPQNKKKRGVGYEGSTC
jgi:hypothetical protein